MDWKDLAGTVGKFAPMLGTLIGGPAGTAIGAMVAAGLGVGNNPTEVAQALQINPDAAVKLRQIQSENQIELQKLLVQSEANRLAADTSAILAVNATMQAEANADHWPTYSWRPFVGFVFGVMFLGVYFVLPLARLPVPAVPTEAWLAIGGVLGVASWFRGKAQADPAIPTDNRG